MKGMYINCKRIWQVKKPGLKHLSHILCIPNVIFVFLCEIVSFECAKKLAVGFGTVRLFACLTV